MRFTNLVDLNRQVNTWLAEVANVRVHATTNAKPVDLLAEERAHLLPLKPISTFGALLAEERKVSRDAFVSFEGNRYGVPWRYAGRFVSVTATASHVDIRSERDLIAVHPRGLLSGLTLPIDRQYEGAPLGGASRDGRALGLQIHGPEVEVRSLATYDALAGGL